MFIFIPTFTMPSCIYNVLLIKTKEIKGPKSQVQITNDRRLCFTIY